MWPKYLQKIIKDILVSLIITYFLLLIPELILPGIISSHFNPKLILLAIIIFGLLFSWQGKRYPPRENVKFGAVSRNILNIILFVVTLMLVLSLYKMKLWQIAITIPLSLALFVAGEYMMIREE